MNMNVITIMENERSVQVADRLIKSGKTFGYNIKKHKAFSPTNCDVLKELEKHKLSPLGFQEKYSRHQNCIAGFLSHHSLWLKCIKSKEPMYIFEHDAVLEGEVPTMDTFDILSIGKPSYGNWNQPEFLGYGPLISKRYFPGAHAYRITPTGAQQLVDEAVHSAGPTDVYIHLDKFKLGEYYPWPAEARDNFTTIQQEQGCLAKHNYGESYEII